MKKLLLFFVGSLFMPNVKAQDFSDALRYSQENIQGTARFSAMSGAFGALGGDLSAVNINPAGSVIFAQSTVNLSIGNFFSDNTSTYFGRSINTDENNRDFNQGGASFVFENFNGNSPWKKFALGVAYDKIQNFDDNWRSSGINPNNTIGQYFLEYAQGQRLDEISAFPGETISEAYAEIGSVFGFGNQQAFLGYESFILDPENETDDNTNYINNIVGGDYFQSFQYNASGYNGKLAINFATQYKEKLYLGINFNSHFLNYERLTFLEERNNNASSFISDVGFENFLRTTGNGFSFQIGGIYKITNEFRVGLSYDSPTWFTISEESSQYLETVSTEILQNNTNLSTSLNPGIINIYPDYRLQTPSKITASLAYVFGTNGLLSFDYSIKDFSNMKFRPTADDYFSFQNSLIGERFDAASTYRFGAEYRIKLLSLRGGYRFEESPYKDDSFYGNLTGYSLGLGYNFGSFSIDLAYNASQRDIGYQLYSNSLDFTESASIENKQTNIILSVGFIL